MSDKWIIPTSHDTGTVWSDPENAYDEDSGTSASRTVASQQWSEYLELYFNAIPSTKVRVWCFLNRNLDEISVDVRRNSDSVWVNIFEDVYAHQNWEEIEIGETLTINGIRLKYFNSHGSFARFARWYQTEIWEIVAVTRRRAAFMKFF